MSSSKAKQVPSFYGVTFGSGDFVSLFSLFFDNLSTLLGFAGAILGLSQTSTLLPVILYERIIPAAGIMLFVGNVFYTYQAVRMSKKYGRPFTAQPCKLHYTQNSWGELCLSHTYLLIDGFNTAGGFPYIFSIIYGGKCVL